jgi:hypothetical protein
MGSGSMTEFPKEDKRPRNGMWAPGSYWCKCVHCDETYIGDKRSVCCADCAYARTPQENASE